MPKLNTYIESWYCTPVHMPTNRLPTNGRSADTPCMRHQQDTLSDGMYG